MMKVHPYLLLAGIVVIGTFLRIYQLGFQTVSCDELYTLAMAKMPVVQGYLYVMSNENNPPLYYILAHFSLLLSGSIDYIIRYPATIFGVLTIPAMYLFGKEWDEYTGLFCAGISAVLYSFVYYSQFARAYTMVTFFSVMFLWLYIRIYKNERPTITDYYLLGIAGSMVLFSHLFGLFFIIIAVVILCFTRPISGVVRVAIPISFALLLSIPMFFVIPTLRALQHFPGISPTELISMIPIEFFNIGLFILLPLIILGIWYVRNNDVSVYLLIIAGGAIIFGMVVAQFTQVFPRYFLPILPIFVLFASIALSKLLMTMKSKYRPVIGIGFFLLLALTQVNALLAHYTIPWLTC